MIKVYYLKVEKDEATNRERPKGLEHVHHAMMECTEKPDVRKLIMDTTPDEHDNLVAVAIEWRNATQDEIDNYNAQVIILPPDLDVERAKELLATSSPVITQSEMWELMRIFGRRLGLR